jgi:hypothetical protein
MMVPILIPSFSTAGQATLSWDPNIDPEVAGYNVYWGIESGQYSESVDVGNQTNYTIYTLAEGQTYYFSVTAYDNIGFESDYANEVQTIVNSPITLCAADLDLDGDVDSQDLSNLNYSFGSTVDEPNYNPANDLNGDGIIETMDLDILTSEYGRSDCS